MLRRHRQIKAQIQQCIDACVFAFSFWFAWKLRADPDIMAFFKLDPINSFESYTYVFLILIPTGPLVLEAQGFYDRSALSPRRMAFRALLKGCLFTTLGLILTLFFVRRELARSVPLLFGIIVFCLVLAKEELMRLGLRTKFARSQMQRRFVLVGTPEDTAAMRERLKSGRHEGMVVLAEHNLNESPISDLAHLLHEHSVNGVIINARHNYFEQIESAIRTCELEGVEAWLVADFFKTQLSRTSLDDFQGRPVLVFRSAPEDSWQSVGKQLLDLSLAGSMAIAISPVLLVVALLIKVTSPGPILFRQQRCGLNGRPFTIYKFRTMVTDAEQRKAELAAMNEMTGPVFKVTNDPRITPIGHFLRKYSLDEFPQLFNVLRGEMSMVGPRPLPVDEVKRFDDLAHRRRLSVKPGLTCLWQISGRNNVKDFRDWVRLDLEYIDNWSLWLDLKILWLTIPVVALGTGAK